MNQQSSLDILLRSLHLPSILREHETMARSAEDGEWSFEQYLRTLVELEVNERHERKIVRLLKRSQLPEGKTLHSMDQKQLPVKVRRQIPTLIEGGFVERAENILAFGLPGRGKTHLLSAIGRELIIRCGYAVLFASTCRLVERLLIAKRDFGLEDLLKKLDRFDVVLLDDIGYVQQSREEMEVLFTLLAERYERGSVMLTSNLPFSKWEQIFKDAMTTAAAIDRLVHHSVILELNVPSYRLENAKKPDRGQTRKKTKSVKK